MKRGPSFDEMDWIFHSADEVVYWLSCLYPPCWISTLEGNVSSSDCIDVNCVVWLCKCMFINRLQLRGTVCREDLQPFAGLSHLRHLKMKGEGLEISVNEALIYLTSRLHHVKLHSLHPIQQVRILTCCSRPQCSVCEVTFAVIRRAMCHVSQSWCKSWSKFAISYAR